MSIIQDALKKAQGYHGEKHQPSHDGRMKKVPSPRVRIAWTMPALVIVFLALAAVATKQFVLESGGRLGNAVPKEAAEHQEVAYKTISPQPAVAEPYTDMAGELAGLPSPKSLVRQDENFRDAALPAHCPKLILSGIMYVSGMPRAVINDRMVKEGDVISGAKVARIEANNVTLTFGDTEITLILRR
jgi:hypothetical protein